MAILRRATDEQQSEWEPVPEGLWRWVVGVPEVKLSEKFGNYQVKFPLALNPDEQARLLAEHGKPAEGIQQSWRTNYTTGLSMGYIQRDGQYKSTKLIDFLAACLGSANGKHFRKWIEQGGGPPRPADKDDQKAELEAIGEWLKWWENLEVYGTITHAADSQQSGVVWARYAGPMPVGSLPGQQDADYQALGRGKLRMIVTESKEQEPVAVTSTVAVAERPPAERYTQAGARVAAPPEEDDELPF